MSFPKPSPKGVLAVLSAAALTSTLGLASAAHAEDQLSGITGVVKNLPGASAVPTNLVQLPGAQPSQVVMEQAGKFHELPVKPVELQQQGRKMSALPVHSDKVIGQGLPGTVPMAVSGPESQLSDEAVSKISWIVQQTGATTGTGANAAGIDPNAISTLSALTDKVAGAGAVQTGPVSATDVTSAAQAAIWHYSEGSNLAANRNSAEVTSVYKYLTGPANTGLPAAGQLPLDLPTNNLVPSTGSLPAPVADLAGGVLGPFSLAEGLNQADVDVSDAPKGTALVDVQGKKTTQMRAGEKYFLTAPAEAPSAQAVMTIISASQTTAGMIMSGVTGNKPQDMLVVTSNDEAPVRQAAQVSWEEKKAAGGAGSSLPLTGSAVTTVAIAGGVLVAVGGGLHVFTRRRRVDAA